MPTSHLQFPKHPALELSGILEGLVHPKSQGDDCIRIYGVRGWIRNRIGNTSNKQISKELGVSYKNITNWLGNGSREIGIPVEFFIKLCHTYHLNFDEIFHSTRFGCTNSKKYSLPGSLGPDIAYLLGYLMGDGHLANPADTISNGSNYNAEIRITTNLVEDLQLLQKIFGSNFSYTPTIYQEHSFYRLVARAKVLHIFFSKILNFPVGNKKKATRVPQIILSCPELERWFLMGFFDADGSICKLSQKYWNIRIKQFNPKMIQECIRIIKERGINVSGPYIDKGKRNGTETTSYVLAIQKRSEIEKFIKEFPSLKILRCEILAEIK